MIRFFLAVSFFVTCLFALEVGDEFMYNGVRYRIVDISEKCSLSGATYPVITLAGSYFYLDSQHDCSAISSTATPILQINVTTGGVDQTPCETDDRGVCYQYLCDGYPTIDGVQYVNTGETDMEVCQYNADGTPTGNIWKDATACSAPTGACLQENNCTAPDGFTEITGISAQSQCNASLLNASLGTDTTLAISEAVWQECNSKCYGKTIPVDCASQVPYSPSLSEGETIYSTTLTLDQCIDYANQNNMDVRYDHYTTNDAPGFSCQDLSFCIVKDRPRSCQGVVTPTPAVSAGETYFIVQGTQQCTDYASNYNVSTRVVHFDDKDNAGQFCYDVDYCVVTPNVDNNGSSTGSTSGGTDSGGTGTGSTTNLPDYTGTNSGTGAQSVDLNGTNQRLDIIDGHLKDLSQTVRDGFDRNHADLNRLSQDIQDGSQLINRGINGLAHSISGALDTISRSGDINVTADFDDSRIVEANNNTTRAISHVGSYLGADTNVSDLNVTFTEFEPIAKAAEDAIETMNTTLADSNLSKEELQTMIEDEVTDSMTDYEDKSKTMLSDLLDRIFLNTFNPFQPFIDVGSVPSNFGSIHFPVNIAAINYHQDVYITKAQLFGDQADPNIAKFYQIMQKLALFIAVIFGFLHMIRGVSNV